MTATGAKWIGTARDIAVGVPLVVGHLVGAPLLRSRYNRWGATNQEVEARMPGGELVADPKMGSTRAISIDAPPQVVWSWLVQLGQGRGGLYSFDGLENLLGCGIHSADSIIDEYQSLDVGDIVKSGDGNYPCWAVMAIEEKHHLVLLGAGTAAKVEIPETVTIVPDEGYAASTWQWLLKPEGQGTRLVVRQRLTFSPNQRLIWRIVEPIHYVMERQMLKGIKSRAEAAH